LKLIERGYKNCQGVDIIDSNYSPSELVKTYSGEISDFPNFANIDVVISSNVLEHLDEPTAYLIHFNEILLPNGLQVHIVPTHFWKFWSAFFYYYQVVLFLVRKIININKYNSDNHNYKSKQSSNLKQSRLLIGRHGSRGTSLDEFKLFNPNSYRNTLRNLNYDFYDFKIPLFYSGHYVFGKLFSINIRKYLSFILGYSCHCFVIKKSL
jgi:hypothetical protein